MFEASTQRACMHEGDALNPTDWSRPALAQVDIEGSECKAFRGMQRFLNSSHRLIGALVEFDKSFECCEELVHPETGAFWLLNQRHSLCPHKAPVAKAVDKVAMQLHRMCDILRFNGRQLNLRWKPCRNITSGSG